MVGSVFEVIAAPWLWSREICSGLFRIGAYDLPSSVLNSLKVYVSKILRFGSQHATDRPLCSGGIDVEDPTSLSI